MWYTVPFPIAESQLLNALSFRKKHMELSEGKLPVNYNLRIKTLNTHSMYLQAAKICNNMLLAITMIGTAEAMNLGIRFVEQDNFTYSRFLSLLLSHMLIKRTFPLDFFDVEKNFYERQMS